MQQPPPQLDNAKVLRWVISERGAFYFIGEAAVAAMAVCQYVPGEFYLFKCTADWTVIQDMDHTSLDECLEHAAQFANGERLVWQER